MKKLGLSILYTDIGKKQPEWKYVKDRDKIKYLREQYWAKNAENVFSDIEKEIASVTMPYSIKRSNTDVPGDKFIYQNSIGLSRTKSGLTWLEITEVFAYNNGKEINEAMREWNDVGNLEKKKFKKLINKMNMARPPRHKQRLVADEVMKSIDDKINKPSYNKNVNSIGKGHLVIGLPLWFATPPIKIMRVENVLDDFITRVHHGLLEIRKNTLKKGNCPFSRITVVWDMSISAMKEWLRQSDLNEHQYFNKFSFMGKPSFFIVKPEIFIEILELLENNMKATDNPSCHLSLSVKLEKEKQLDGWQKNLKVISQNPDIDKKVILMLEKITKKFKKEEQSNIKKYKKKILNIFLRTAFNITMYARKFGLYDLFKELIKKISLKHKFLVMWLVYKQRKLYLKSMSREREILRDQ